MAIIPRPRGSSAWLFHDDERDEDLRSHTRRPPARLVRGRCRGPDPGPLRGKRKPEYTPHIDTGDFIVVVNAEKIRVTGKKLEQKTYWRHSGYPGGIKSRSLAEMLDRRPEEVIRKAVKGMLPRNRLARQQLTKLKVYAGPDHPHAAQQPKPREISK